MTLVLAVLAIAGWTVAFAQWRMVQALRASQRAALARTEIAIGLVEQAQAQTRALSEAADARQRALVSTCFDIQEAWRQEREEARATGVASVRLQ